jgi:D-serine deaminase-like pyridoxal phosphate-dependent protein
VGGEVLNWGTKGFWLPNRSISYDAFIAAKHNIFEGPFVWPLLVVQETAITSNILVMASYCRVRGVELAPHGKTTMSPMLFRAQLDAGAWGISVATPNQILVARKAGVDRLLFANELYDYKVLQWLAEEIRHGFDFYCYVDTPENVKLLSSVSSSLGSPPFKVLLELGYKGGRTGCRSYADAEHVARVATAADGVKLCGVSGFEGLMSDKEKIINFLVWIKNTTRRLSDMDLLGEQVILTAGGSDYFDLVVDQFEGDWLPTRQLTVVLRSGAYVSHDSGSYDRISPLGHGVGNGSLSAALEVWAQALSIPEPGLAIVGMGRRDAPFDDGLPVPLRKRLPTGEITAVRDMSVVRINDQHAYLQYEGHEISPGDLLAFGISHPCTAFDKWRVIPIVDESYCVVDLLDTYF